MAKALDYTFDLPYTPEQLFQEGVKREYIEAQAKALHHYGLEIVSLETGPEGGRALARYEIDVDLPSWAKKILQPRNKVTEIRNWPGPDPDGSRRYSFTVQIANVPVEVKGQVRLDAVPGGTRNVVHVDLRAGVPIFGGKLEELVAGDLGATIEAEAAYIVTWMNAKN